VLPADGEGGRLLLERAGSQAQVSFGSAKSECRVSAQRAAVGVCASELGAVRVTRISVQRKD